MTDGGVAVSLRRPGIFRVVIALVVVLAATLTMEKRADAQVPGLPAPAFGAFTFKPAPCPATTVTITPAAPTVAVGATVTVKVEVRNKPVDQFFVTGHALVRLVDAGFVVDTLLDDASPGIDPERIGQCVDFDVTFTLGAKAGRHFGCNVGGRIGTDGTTVALAVEFVAHGTNLGSATVACTKH